MPCYHPLTGYRSRLLSSNGKRPIVFSAAKGFIDQPVEVPCGRCIGCRLDYSRQWAVRCMHESTLHDCNSFVTLTYRNEDLPYDHSVHKEHLQKFFKRFRKKFGNNSLRYFACGEYGDKSGRPHYHAILFGVDFSSDRYLYSIRNGHSLYRSAVLEDLWPFGHSLIGDVTFESCAYVARYVMKKRKGKDDEVDPATGKTNAEYYEAVIEDTGEIVQLEPEFCLMSRRPGIGRGWIDKYQSDTDKDFITLNGNKMSLPKYYDSVLEAANEDAMFERKKLRRKRANAVKEDNTQERLSVKEKVKLAQIDNLVREDF